MSNIHSQWAMHSSSAFHSKGDGVHHNDRMPGKRHFILHYDIWNMRIKIRKIENRKARKRSEQ